MSETRELPPFKFDESDMAYADAQLYLQAVNTHNFRCALLEFHCRERQLSEALRERDEKQALLDQVLPSEDDPLCARIVNSGTFDPEIQKAREGGTIGDWMRRAQKAERERDEAREALRKLVDHFDSDFEDPGLELYGLIGGKEMCPGGVMLNRYLNEARAILTPPTKGAPDAE